MTKNQKKQYNRMVIILRKIHNGYQTPAQIEGSCDKLGLDYAEALEMSYQNIQIDAKTIVKGVRML